MIKGTIANAGGLQLFLDHINYNNSNDVIAKAEIDNQGKFEVPLEEGLENGIYRIRIGVKKAFFVFDGNEKVVTIDGDLASFDSYNFKVEGSAPSKQFCEIMQQKADGIIDDKELLSVIKSTPNTLMASFLLLKSFPLFFNRKNGQLFITFWDFNYELIG